MSLTPSNMLALNSPLPSFRLPDAEGPRQHAEALDGLQYQEEMS